MILRCYIERVRNTYSRIEIDFTNIKFMYIKYATRTNIIEIPYTIHLFRTNNRTQIIPV